MKDAVLFARTVFARRTDLWISTFTDLDPDTDRMGPFTKYADAFSPFVRNSQPHDSSVFRSSCFC